MKILFILILSVLTSLPATAQTLTTVMVDAEGKVVAPADFWEANAANLKEDIALEIADVSGLNIALEGKQNTSTRLTNWLNIPGTNNHVPYITGTNTFSTALSSLSGRNLWNIGGSANHMPYLNATNTWTTFLTTPYGRTLLSQADASTLATSLPEGTKYAVFDLELGGNFTDFELKATVQNYSQGNMVFFYHSPDPAKNIIYQQIWTTRPDVYFTDSQYRKPTDFEMNQRVWRKQNATQSIAVMRTNGNSVVASVTVVVKDTGAINPDNENLVFTWCKMTPTGYEEDAAGNSIWRTVTPKWVKKVPVIVQ